MHFCRRPISPTGTDGQLLFAATLKPVKVPVTARNAEMHCKNVNPNCMQARVDASAVIGASCAKATASLTAPR